jgi:hypothetical protein
MSAALKERSVQPAEIRSDMEQWFANAGAAKVFGRAIKLSDPPASLLKLAQAEDSIIAVQPAGCSAAQLSELFNMANWAAAGLETVSEARADQDRWFVTPATDLAPHMGQSPEAVMKAANGKKGMSLEQYIVFAARFRALRGSLPDINYWTWLPESHERNLLLFAGFDSYGNLQINSCTPDYVDDNTGCRLIMTAS